ncbi:MAG: hypothetical protein IAE83_02810 [Anaerolinea sp.]|nr:hypothetical protein [Anaerolinea sp.]
MSDDRLRLIQTLQFRDKTRAETLLLAFINEIFPTLDVEQVELRPQAVSLNSFNGFLTLQSGAQLFFKTHVEPQSVISEYYNSDVLAEAGYPIVRPLYASTEYGRQLLIYDLVHAPSVFEVARALERGERGDFQALMKAQNDADDYLSQIYHQTLAWVSGEDAAGAPIHQLFYHRLGSRYSTFYEEKPFTLPGERSLPWEAILERRWIINGVRYEGTLGDAIVRARTLLQPARQGWTIIGHGDAHNGNVFFTPEGLRYFDPAFGGRHSPWLDLAKPLFHNVSATWMYHPHEIASKLQLSFHDDGSTFTIEHDYQPSTVRQMFKTSKIERVYKPLIEHLTTVDKTPRAYYDDVLSAALMCCPLLTMNLADRERFPAEIGLLGLVMCVQVGMLAE